MVVWMVCWFVNGRGMVMVLGVIRGLRMWEYWGLVKEKENVRVKGLMRRVGGV